MEYVPDRWVVLKVNSGTEITNKVFAGWHGSYLEGNSWKLNSGNVTETDFPDRWEFVGYTGSLYVCHKRNYGMNSYMESILDNWKASLAERNIQASIEVLASYAE